MFYFIQRPLQSKIWSSHVGFSLSLKTLVCASSPKLKQQSSNSSSSSITPSSLFIKSSRDGSSSTSSKSSKSASSKQLPPIKANGNPLVSSLCVGGQGNRGSRIAHYVGIYGRFLNLIEIANLRSSRQSLVGQTYPTFHITTPSLA